MTVALGFRAKTGRAICVALAEPARAPEFVWRGDVSLVDPKAPETGQPHHEVMELPWEEALVAVQPLVKRLEVVARDTIASLMRKFSGVCAIGIVGSPYRSLTKLGNFHILAHAAEGILFRRVLEFGGGTSQDSFPRLFGTAIIQRIKDGTEKRRIPFEVAWQTGRFPMESRRTRCRYGCVAGSH